MTIQLLFGYTDDNSMVILNAGEVQYRFPTAEVPGIVRSLRALCTGTAKASEHDLRAFYVPPDEKHPSYRIGLATTPAVVINEGKFRMPSPAYLTSFEEAAIIAEKFEHLYDELRRVQH
jgi:hypothetical protein